MSTDWIDCQDWIDATNYYGPPDAPEIAAAKKTKFYRLAERALERFGALPGFETDMEIIPVDPSGKRPAKNFMPNHEAIEKTEQGLALAAMRYPNANAGVRSRRALDAMITIDCDRPGVVERIEAETGRKLPRTFTTQTRPSSAPHKMHLTYRSTACSVRQLPLQVTDVTDPCGFDLKGNGGWGYIVTEGSVRDGEAITVCDAGEIAPVPDWLVGWLVADVRRGRDANRRARKRKAEAAARAATAAVRGFAVPRGDRTYAIKSRIRTWKNCGMSNDEILPLLKAHIRAYFQDGDEMLTTGGVRKLRGMVREVPTLGASSYCNLLRDRRSRRKSPLHQMREKLETAPPRLTSAEARSLLDVHTHADEQRMGRQLRHAHYVLLGPQGSHNRVWIRLRRPASVSQQSLQTLSSQNPYGSVSAHAQTATSSESESEGFAVSQVVAGREVADAALTLTSEKDGRSVKTANAA